MTLNGVRLLSGDRTYSIRIEKDLIAAITPDDPERLSSAAGPPLYAIPALVDSHLHVSFLPDSAAVDMLRAGVMTVRDVGGRIGSTLAWAKHHPHLSVLHYGEPLDGSPPEVRAGIYGAVGTGSFDDVRRHIDRLVRSSASGVKLYYGFPWTLLQQTVTLAHSSGLRIAAHLGSGSIAKFSRVTPQEFALAGGDTVEHVHSFTRHLLRVDQLADFENSNDLSSPFSRIFTAWSAADLREATVFDAIGDFAETSCAVVPTLGVLAAVGRCLSRSTSGELQVKTRQENSELAYSLEGFQRMLRFVGILHRTGVKILAGTDLASAEGEIGIKEGIHFEIRLLRAAGLSPAAAIAAATTVPCQVLGLRGEGTISVGAKANLLLVRANNLEEIVDEWNVRAVIRHGEFVCGEATPVAT